MTELLTAQAPPRTRVLLDRARLLRRQRAFAPVAIGLFAFLLSEIGNWIPSVWYDETATVSSATRSWAQLWDEVQHVDAVHAAYYAFMHLVFDLVGYSPFTLRLPSAVAVGLTAAAVVILVRLFAGERTAVLAGVLFAINPRTTWMGGEGRSYAASALFAVLLTLALVIATRSTRRRWWVIYGALAVVSCLLFVYLGFIIVGHAVFVAARSRRGTSRVARKWVLSVAAAAVILSPFALLVKSEKSQVSWIDPLDVDSIRQVYETQWFWGTAVLPALGWIMVIVGAILLIRRPGGRMLAAVILPAIVIPTTALVLISVFYTPVYSPRYVALSTPFVAMAMAVALAAVRWKWGRIAIIAVIVGCIVPHLLLAQRIPTAKQDSTWSQVADLIGEQRAALPTGTPVAVLYGSIGSHHSATARTIEYAYPANFVGTIDPGLLTPAAETGGLWEKTRSIGSTIAAQPSLFQGARVTYLITGITHDKVPATTTALTDAGWRVGQTWTLGAMRVVEYTR